MLMHLQGYNTDTIIFQDLELPKCTLHVQDISNTFDKWLTIGLV